VRNALHLQSMHNSGRTEIWYWYVICSHTLQDAHVFRDHCSTLVAKNTELEARAQVIEAQNFELLDFIQVA